VLNLNEDLNFSGGIFFFTVGGVFDPAPSGQTGTTTLKVFRAPLGGCTGAITVEVPSAFPLPATIPVFVSELGPAQSAATGIAGAPKGFELINIQVVSESGQLLAGPAFDYLLSGFNTTTLGLNEGGGVASVSAAVTSPLDPNNASQETRVLFTNRPLPSIVKVCKVAGPGVPLNTPFVFEVRGFMAQPNPPAPGQIFTFPGQVRFVEVLAGPAAQGGNCTIVRDADGTASKFANSNDAVLVRELGALDPAVAFDPNPEIAPPTVKQLADADGVLRDIRISRIRAFVAAPNGQISPGVFAGGNFTIGGPAIDFSPAPDLTPNSALTPADDRPSSVGAVDLGRAAVRVRQNEVAVEFTDILFNPTQIKICKIAGMGIAQGTPFTFTVTQNQPPEGNLLPAFSTNVSVPAGPGDQGGFCTIVPTTLANGIRSGLVGGAFNVGSSVTVTENGTNNISAITSSTTPITRNGASVVADPLVEAANVVTYTNNGPTQGVAAVKFDFDGDHKSDAALWTPSLNRVTFAKSGSNNEIATYTFGRLTDKLVLADYDGDGITDRAIFRPETGQWFWLGSARNEYHITSWGEAGDTPIAADYDGDGRSDYVIFRPSNGTWYVRLSGGGITVFQFGVSTDKPIAADYDGDGKTDAAVFRPSTGQWFIAGSRDGYAIYNFGVSTDKPVPADYDGDGKADIAVFRNNGAVGTWYILGTTGIYNVIDFGKGDDIAAPADYDGDGKTDLAVYRPSEGKWYIRLSGLSPASTIGTISLGDASDIPLASM
jgi:hypothetical protein